ncbi:alpha/beta hydrolase [Streptomyces sp. NPDC057757]|uniref:alpha/beta hydrolase n=1 Tax=Streptomyces sp. NPDC057757 TaxID=3346241 RepID=UPI0036A76947
MRLQTASALSLTALLLAGTTTACRTDPIDAGGAPAVLPASLTGQKLSWKACPAPSVMQGTDEQPQPFEDGTAWQCATMRAPLDYADPEGEKISLALIRARAEPAATKKGAPPRRLGSLVFNFGGPGGSGVATLPQYAQDYPHLHERYDLVSFDPRGVGDSEGVRCLDDKALQSWFATDSSPDDAAEARRYRQGWRDFARACAKNSATVLPHVDTVSAARDMDLMRQVLGDRRLNYLGISYGSELGAVYAHLFPRRVGRTVLDAVVDPTQDDGAGALGQAHGFQLALENFMKECAEARDCPTGSGAEARKDPAEGTRKITALLQRIDRKPLRTDDGSTLTQAEATTGIMAALYSKGTWGFLKVGLADAMTKGDGEWLQLMSDGYYSRDDHGRYSNLHAANTAVLCADSSDRYSERDIRARLPRFREASPVFGESMAWALLNCADWKVRPGSSPTVEAGAKGAAPIVVIGTTGDPATPYEGARRMAGQLGEGVGINVTYRGDGHGAYPGSACVTAAVNGYLLNGKVPADGTVCS